MPNKIKVLNIVGARPQIIKSSAISRIISSKFADEIEEIILHTGQHYDKQMSDVFFEELDIPDPHYNLNVGSASHGQQTAAMITGIEDVLISAKPDAVIIYGDTNSTLAAAIATSKVHIPLIHIEAGLRSFNKLMPEEVNRVLSDHVSTLLFAPTDVAYKNLIKEGLRPENKPPYTLDNPKVFQSGDIMYDNSLYFAEVAEKKLDGYLDRLNVVDNRFVLVTIHRAANTDDPGRLGSIMEGILEIASISNNKIVMPLHPRTVKALEKLDSNIIDALSSNPDIKILAPVSYLEMTYLEKHCKMIITDSGGVQKESHFFSKPSIVLRNVTEWVELVENGTTTLVDADRAKMLKSFTSLSTNESKLSYPGFYGDGNASEFIVKELLELLVPD